MIKRYIATIDNTITNAYKEIDPVSGSTLRATGSNMGQADTLETFTIYNAASPGADQGFIGAGGVDNNGSKELSRILVQFDMNSLIADRNSGVVPTGSTYYLRMYNAPQSETTPTEFTLQIANLDEPWSEGLGTDMNLPYPDLTYDVAGSNWWMASGSVRWASSGSLTPVVPSTAAGATRFFTQYFKTGLEDLEVDITPLVNEWYTEDKANYGVIVRFDAPSEEADRSYYTKQFFARSTSRYFDRPVIEARWDSSRRDDRGNFYTYSHLAPGPDNINTLYLYNYVRGRLRDIPSVTGSIYVSLHLSQSGFPGIVQCTNTPATGSKVSTGIYSAEMCVNTTASTLYDVWYDGAIQYHTGTISTKSLTGGSHVDTNKYVLSVSNKNTQYYQDQTHRIRLYARYKDWSPNIYTVATSVPNSLVFATASYQVHRIIDDRVVIAYGTGSTMETRLSYDVSGNYFDLDTSLLEANYTYGINFSIYDPDTQSYEQQPYTYKFRVVDNEY